MNPAFSSVNSCLSLKVDHIEEEAQVLIHNPNYSGCSLIQVAASSNPTLHLSFASPIQEHTQLSPPRNRIRASPLAEVHQHEVEDEEDDRRAAKLYHDFLFGDGEISSVTGTGLQQQLCTWANDRVGRTLCSVEVQPFSGLPMCFIGAP